MDFGSKRVVGLTGSIGSGKSTVAEMFRTLGAEVIDADQIATEILETGGEAFSEVEKAFGTPVLTADRQIDRQKLAEIVFEDPQARRCLNQITHPRVVQKIVEQLQKVPEAVPLILLDIPLLLEEESTLRIDPTVVIYVDPEAQRKRIREKTGWSDRHIEQRIIAQRPLLEKITEAQFVIDNSGTVEQTRKQVEALWLHLL